MHHIEIPDHEDGPHILGLVAAAGVFNGAEQACVEELWDAYLKAGEASGYIFMVSRQGAKISGLICYGPTPLTEGTFDLYWIAVAPWARKQGVGGALLQTMEDDVVRRGGRLVVVETGSTAPYGPARRFYAGHGYRHEATIRDFYEVGDDLNVFTKRMASDGQGQGA